MLPVGQVGIIWDASMLQLPTEWVEVCHQCPWQFLILKSRCTVCNLLLISLCIKFSLLQQSLRKTWARKKSLSISFSILLHWMVYPIYRKLLLLWYHYLKNGTQELKNFFLPFSIMARGQLLVTHLTSCYRCYMQFLN